MQEVFAAQELSGLESSAGKIAAAPATPEPAAAIVNEPEASIGVNETLARLEKIKKGSPAAELEIKPVERSLIPEDHVEKHADDSSQACERCCIYRKKVGSEYCLTCEKCMQEQKERHGVDEGRTE